MCFREKKFFCTSCGRYLPEFSRYCDKCGTKQDWQGEQATPLAILPDNGEAVVPELPGINAELYAQYRKLNEGYAFLVQKFHRACRSEYMLTDLPVTGMRPFFLHDTFEAFRLKVWESLLHQLDVSGMDVITDGCERCFAALPALAVSLPIRAFYEPIKDVAQWFRGLIQTFDAMPYWSDGDRKLVEHYKDKNTVKALFTVNCRELCARHASIAESLRHLVTENAIAEMAFVCALHESSFHKTSFEMC